MLYINLDLLIHLKLETDWTEITRKRNEITEANLKRLPLY